MPCHHSITIQLVLIPFAVVGGAWCSSASAQIDFEFTDSGQELGQNSRSLATGDVDGDGDLDAVITYFDPEVPNAPTLVWINDGSGTFSDSGQQLGFNGFSVTLGDLDGDDDLDVMIAGATGLGSPNTVWINDGTGSFSDSGQALGNAPSFSIVLGDLDGDQDLDALVTNYQQADAVWTNDGNGNFTKSDQLVEITYGLSSALGDLDGDGDLDVVVANYLGQPNQILFNDGSGTLTDSGQQLGTGYSQKAALGDFDGDGDLDLLVVNGNGLSGQVNTVWINDGAGTFSDSGQVLESVLSVGVDLGDLDDDGDLDAVVVGFGVPNSILLNDGSGTFTQTGPGFGTFHSIDVELGDLDGDGRLDALIGNSFNDSNLVWFQRTVCVGDINADGSIAGEDLAFLLADWDTDSEPADLNGDGTVDGIDLAFVLARWGTDCED